MAMGVETKPPLSVSAPPAVGAEYAQVASCSLARLGRLAFRRKTEHR